MSYEFFPEISLTVAVERNHIGYKMYCKTNEVNTKYYWFTKRGHEKINDFQS